MARESGWWMSVTQSLPLTEHTVEVEGLELYYRTGGSGPPLLLLHGGTVVGQLWNPFLDALGEHYSVIVPDLPGHGRSPSFPPEGFAFGAIARIMLGLVETLGLEQVQGIGVSAGAAVLLHMAVQRPEVVEAIVPVAGAHFNRPWPKKVIADWTWENRSPEAKEFLLSLHPGGVPQIRALSACLRESVSATDPSGDKIALERLQSTPTRTLFVLGDRDPIVPIELVLEAYRALPNAAFWVIPGGGHGAIWASEETQASFLDVVHRFFLGELAG
jgi:pimeloyl-ACP methyl ester carboxylesterase